MNNSQECGPVVKPELPTSGAGCPENYEKPQCYVTDDPTCPFVGTLQVVYGEGCQTTEELYDKDGELVEAGTWTKAACAQPVKLVNAEIDVDIDEEALAQAIAQAALSTAVSGDYSCVNIDGTPGYARPVSIISPSTGVVTSVIWLDRMGQKIDDEVTEASPCDCPCITCP